MNTVFLHNWSKVTSNAWVLQSVKGYWLELIKELQQWKHLGMSQKDLRLVMAKLLQAAKEVEQVVKEVETVEGQFVRQIFLVPKKDGSQRPVVNLKPLNHYIKKQNFKMEGLHMLRDLLKREDWMA